MDFGVEKAIYLQIIDFVCEQILNGRWHAGERMLSVRELAAMLEVNPNTVTRSYNELTDKNIIVTKRGIGFFITENAPELIRNEQKAQFLQNELPRFFKKMNLLGISMQDINNLYLSFEN